MIAQVVTELLRRLGIVLVTANATAIVVNTVILEEHAPIPGMRTFSPLSHDNCTSKNLAAATYVLEETHGHDEHWGSAQHILIPPSVPLSGYNRRTAQDVSRDPVCSSCPLALAALWKVLTPRLSGFDVCRASPRPLLKLRQTVACVPAHATDPKPSPRSFRKDTGLLPR